MQVRRETFKKEIFARTLFDILPLYILFAVTVDHFLNVRIGHL